MRLGVYVTEVTHAALLVESERAGYKLTTLSGRSLSVRPKDIAALLLTQEQRRARSGTTEARLPDNPGRLLWVPLSEPVYEWLLGIAKERSKLYGKRLGAAGMARRILHEWAAERGAV